jgi:hypothetical protein
MLIYDKSEQLTPYIWDRVAVIGGVEGDKMRNVATLDWLAHISKMTSQEIPFMLE